MPMQRYLLYLIIITNIISSTKSFSQIIPKFVRFDTPSFVSVNNNFTTSLIFKIDVVTNEPISIKFSKPNSVNINKATLSTLKVNKNISVLINEEDKNEIVLELSAEEFSLEANYPYQILLDCNTQKQIKFDKGLFAWIDEKIEKSSDDLFEFGTGNEFDETQIYEVQKTAGNSVKFVKFSELQFKIFEENGWNRLYTEFWVQSDELLEDFLVIEKLSTKDTLVSISKNVFGFITFPINENELIRNDVYMGQNNWNYIGILLSNSVTGLKSDVYVNSELAYSTYIDNNFGIENLVFNFNNNSDVATFDIDRLKVWKFENNQSIAQKNKHFLTYEADSSQIIYQSNFDNAGEFSKDYKTNRLEIIGKNLDYVKSEAPIFSKAPSLTVSIGSSYNSIVWYVQEYSVAKEFAIERAISDGNFEVVYTALADNDPLKIYYFTDELINENEVAYYRVKQINEDGSEVFSAEVKIGNKEVQEFNLSQNYPNPFNPVTSIYVEVIIPTEFKVKVYDLVGNTVGELFEGFLAEGTHTFEFDGSNLPSGIYFYEVISPKSQFVKKMILAK
jgi:Secretion system C-terminal sorting domain